VQPAERESGAPIGDVLSRWRPGRGAAFLRSYSDAVNAALVREWLPHDARQSVLKTDLFDEAVNAGLYPELRARARKVVGVDISTPVLEAARARYPDLDARYGDVRALDLPDATFDAIISNSTLDHFLSREEIADALAELRRVLVPRGRLLLTLDNADNPLIAARNRLPDAFLLRLGLIPYPTGTTCSHRELARLLEEAGFEIVAMRAVMHAPRVLVRMAAAAVGARKQKLMRAVLACERLREAPTRYLTGYFLAVLAVRA
jgi:SAM-dependent methyltransferase